MRRYSDQEPVFGMAQARNLTWGKGDQAFNLPLRGNTISKLPFPVKPVLVLDVRPMTLAFEP